MYETDFWQIIDETRDAADGDPDDQADLLVERLVQLTPDEVIDFARLFEARFQRAYTRELWGRRGCCWARCRRTPSTTSGAG